MLYHLEFLSAFVIFYFTWQCVWAKSCLLWKLVSPRSVNSLSGFFDFPFLFRFQQLPVHFPYHHRQKKKNIGASWAGMFKGLSWNCMDRWVNTTFNFQLLIYKPKKSSSFTFEYKLGLCQLNVSITEVLISYISKLQVPVHNRYNRY